MRYVIFTICLLLSTWSYSQVTQSLMSEADTVLIGDEVRLLYMVQIPQEHRLIGIDFGPMIKSLKSTNSFNGEERDADVDWSGKFSKYDNNTIPVAALGIDASAKTQVYTDTIKLAFYEPGLFSLTSPILLLDTLYSQPEIMTLQLPEIMVGVTRKTSDFIATAQDSVSPEMLLENLAGNKEIVKTPKVWQDYIWHVLIPLFLLLILLGIWLYWRNQQKLASMVILKKPIAPAHYYAEKRLNAIEREKVWVTGDDKSYQSELTYTIREYLENRYNIKALESTTDEIKKSLKGEVNLTQEAELLEILQIADLVKFAKAKPTEDINQQFLVKAKNFVAETKIIDNEFKEADYFVEVAAYEKQQAFLKKKGRI